MNSHHGRSIKRGEVLSCVGEMVEIKEGDVPDFPFQWMKKEK